VSGNLDPATRDAVHAYEPIDIVRRPISRTRLQQGLRRYSGKSTLDGLPKIAGGSIVRRGGEPAQAPALALVSALRAERCYGGALLSP